MEQKFSQLENYYKILEGKKKAKFLKADLDKLIAKIEKIMESCYLCERNCRIDRLHGKWGHCKAPNHLLISSEFLHYGEEFFFTPSHTIFFMGCSFHCQFCQNWTISQWFETEYEISPKELAKTIKVRQQQGSRNVNFVGGEPTPYLLWILKTLKEMKKLKVNLPIVWNSNFYMSEETMKILNEVVDVFLSDFKYANNECAWKLSKVKKYFDVVSRNHLLADGEIVIRHLILPERVKCCTFPVLEWIAKNLGNRCIVNLMDQYTPHYNVLKDEKYADMRRRITSAEFKDAMNKAKELKLNCIC